VWTGDVVMVVREDPGGVSGAHPSRGEQRQAEHCGQAAVAAAAVAAAATAAAAAAAAAVNDSVVTTAAAGAGRPAQSVGYSDSFLHTRHRTRRNWALRSPIPVWRRKLLVACGSRAEWCTGAAWDCRTGP